MQDVNQFFKNKINSIELGKNIIQTMQKWIGKKYTFQQFEMLEIKLFKKGEKVDKYKIKTRQNSFENFMLLYLENIEGVDYINSINY